MPGYASPVIGACAILALSVSLGAGARADIGGAHHLDLARQGSQTVGPSVAPASGRLDGFELSGHSGHSAFGLAHGLGFERWADARSFHLTSALRVSLVPFVVPNVARTAAAWRFIDVFVDVGGLLGVGRRGGARRLRWDLFVGPGIELRLGIRSLRRLPTLAVRYRHRAGVSPRDAPRHTLLFGVGVATSATRRLEL